MPANPQDQNMTKFINQSQINSQSEKKGEYHFEGPYAIMYHFILYHPKIDADCKLLYLTLSNLSNQKGYCWASTKYLAEKTMCSERELNRRLSDLQKNNIIHRETIKNGMTWSRKIYVWPFKENSTNSPNSHDRCDESNLKKCLRTDDSVMIDMTISSQEEYKMINKENDLIDMENESDKFSDGKPICRDSDDGLAKPANDDLIDNKNNNLHKSIKSDQPAEAHDFPQTKEVVNMRGEKIVATYSDFVRNALRKNKLWATSLLEEAWKVFLDKTQPFTDWLGYLFKICETIEKKGNLWKHQNKTKCKEKKDSWKNWKVHKPSPEKSSSGTGTEKRPYQTFAQLCPEMF